MSEDDWLAEAFQAHRGHLRAVAYRMLGSAAEADDAVQEAWLRLRRSGTGGVANLGGWLTTVVARICLDMLRSRQARREEPLDGQLDGLPPGSAAGRDGAGDPEAEALLADSVGLALLVVLDTLAPAERVTFVLHDMFAVPFGEIAPIVGRSPGAAKQLASRARRRVRGAGTGPDQARQQELVSAFLAASRGGDFAALIALLDPDAVVRADSAALAIGAAQARGAAAVAATFAGRAQAIRQVLVDGTPGWVWQHRGEPRVVFTFGFAAGKIAAVEMIADPDRIRQLTLVTVKDQKPSSP